MFQSLVRSTSLFWIEVQTTVEEVHKQIQFLMLRIIHTLSIGHQPGLKITRGLCEIQDFDDILQLN